MDNKGKKVFLQGLWKENAVFRLLLGLCPTLAVATSALNGIGMGLCTTFVLLCSNLVVSSLRKIIPQKMRIPCFIVIIASFVTIVDLLMQGYFFSMHKKLGIFIPLIVVNCIILGRAESFASRNGLFYSILDGLGMGIGFTLSLTVLGMLRELIGTGSFLGIQLIGRAGSPLFLIMILPPGAFITLGLLLAFINFLDDKKRRGKSA